MAMERRREVPASIMGPRVILLLCVLALLLIGLVMVYSTSSVKAINEGLTETHYIVRQLIYAGAGIFLALIVWRFVPPRVWSGPLLWGVWAFAILLLLATAATGSTEFGATRWLTIGSFSLQPSEFAKIAFVLMAARIVSNYVGGLIEFRAACAQGILFVITPAVLLVYKAQPDLGTTVIIFVGVYAVMWLAGISARILIGIAAVGVVFLLYAIFGTDYRSGRLVYLDPWNDGQDGYGSGYNIIRSYYAIAEGGLFGVGLGNSHEKYQYIFAPESDFIYAILSEELGMVGSLAVIALFTVFLVAGLRISAAAPDMLGALVAGGCVVMIVFQAFLNIGCVIGILPTTGKPLPFISHGGSSLLATMIMVGLILSVSRAEEQPSIYEQRRADLRIVRTAEDARGDRFARCGDDRFRVHLGGRFDDRLDACGGNQDYVRPRMSHAARR